VSTLLLIYGLRFLHTWVDTPILDCFFQIQTSLLRKDYESCLEKSGKFCELFTRVIQKLSNIAPTPLNKEIHVKRVLDRIKSQPKDKLEDIVRITMPSVIECIYTLRSKRGGGHFKKDLPKEHDAHFAAEGCLWLLKELLTSQGQLGSRKIEALFKKSKVIDSNNPLIEEHDGTFTFLEKLTLKEKILLILDKLYPESITLKKLLKAIKGNESSIRSAIYKLEKDGLIVKLEKNREKIIEITSKGLNSAKKIYESRLK